MDDILSTFKAATTEARCYVSQHAKVRDLWSVGAGAMAFWSTLALATLAQQKLLGISTGTPPPAPTVAGFFGVCAASLAAHEAAVATYQYVETGTVAIGGRRRSGARYDDDDCLHLTQHVRIPLHAVRICCLGLMFFKLFGGRFWAIAPSSYTHLGSFSRRSMSIPATQNYATSAERLAMERMGRAAGCHTCGSRMLFSRGSFKFVGDHMPPKSVATAMNRRLHRRLMGWKVAFRFYPQCRDCSSVQGSILSKATFEMRNQSKGPFSIITRKNRLLDLGDSPSYFHGWRPRINHLAGGVLGAVAVVGADDADIISNGSRFRYAVLHEEVEYWAHRAGRWISKTSGGYVRKP